MDNSLLTVLGFAVGAISMAYCGFTAEKKGYSTLLWVLLGFLGGLIAALAIALMPDLKAKARSAEVMRLQEERDAVALERERLALERERRLLEEERQRLGRGDSG